MCLESLGVVFFGAQHHAHRFEGPDDFLESLPSIRDGLPGVIVLRFSTTQEGYDSQ
jgi:hypothetical protein